MKRVFLLALLSLVTTSLFAQYYMDLIDNQGNRTQTYPKVTNINPEVQSMVDQVDTANLYNSIAWMQLFIRDAYSPEALIVQNWLVEQFETLGLEPSVFYFYVDYPTFDTLDAGNVIAVQRGTKYPDEYIMVSSHYDHPDGPGADDNASGTAGMLEAARILSQYEFDRSIIYVSFNLEENGKYGSFEYTEECARQNMNIIGGFNLDMLGWYPPELDTIKMYTACYHLTRNLYDYYTSVANLYLPETPTLWLTQGEERRGDHASLHLYEYPAIYLGDIEYLDEHPSYHSPGDTIGNGVNNFALAKAFVQATIAATAELANGNLPPQHLAATCDASNIYVRWDAAEYADHYKLFKDDELIAELTESQFEDGDANDGQLHDYYVTAVMSDGTESNPSNHDLMQVTPPLTLPFYNGFEENTDGLRFYDTLWIRKDDVLKNLCESNQQRNDYFTYAESQWFSIPSNAPDATLSFYRKKLFPFDYLPSSYHHFIVEATTDRVHWHKLALVKRIDGYNLVKEVSLRDFIGEPYLQVRFLIEMLLNVPTREENNPDRSSFVEIDDFTIDFSSVSVPEHVQFTPFSCLEVYPNPAHTGLEVRTDVNDAYPLAVYNLWGIKVMEIPNFRDGSLDVSPLPDGMYFVKATKNGKSIAKRIVKQ